MYLSTFIQKKKRLEHQKLNDLVYVRYNLRLQNRYYYIFIHFHCLSFYITYGYIFVHVLKKKKTTKL